MKLVLLPGLDGTGTLFVPFLNVLPAHYSPLVFAYPTDEKLSFTELTSYAERYLPASEDYVLVAESFSGPVAIELAARQPPTLRALVLCATFISNPAPLSLDLGFLFRDRWCAITPPQFFITAFLMGPKAPAALVESLQETLRVVSPGVLAFRARCLFQLDERKAFSDSRVPILYIAPKGDKLLKRTCLEELRKLKPEMEVTEIDGPHFILQRHPQECFEVIDQFVRRAVESNGNPYGLETTS